MDTQQECDISDELSTAPETINDEELPELCESPGSLDLPSEVVLSLVPLLHPTDIARLSLVCQQWSHALNDDRVWHAMFVNRWGQPSPSQLGESRGQNGDVDMDEDSGSTVEPTEDILKAAGSYRDLFVNRWSLLRGVARSVEAIVLQASSDETPAWGTTKLLDYYGVWVPIFNLVSSCEATCHRIDIVEFLLMSKNPVVNLAGMQWYLQQLEGEQMATIIPGWDADQQRLADAEHRMLEVQSLARLAGCSQRRMSLRWWTLGRLGHGFSWRGQDEVHLLSGTLEELVVNHCMWKVLASGCQNEVRRIALVDESHATSSVFSSWLATAA